MAHQAGFDNVVASLGTALTPGQVALLTRYATRIALAYDVDAAGEKAGDARGDRARGADRPAPARTLGRQARGRPGRPAARRQGPRRGRARDARPLGDRDRQGQAARRIPDRPPRRPVRPQDSSGGGSASSRPSCRPSARSPTRSAATRRSGQVRTRVRRRGARPAPGPRAAGAQPDQPVAGRRITADAVLSSPDALPIDDILRAITPVESELLRLLLLVPDQQLRVVDELGPDQLPSTVARELFRAIVLQRAPERPGRPPAVRLRGAAGRPRRRDGGARPGVVCQGRAGSRGLDPARRSTTQSTAPALELEDDQLRRAQRLRVAAELARPSGPATARPSAGSCSNDARSTKRACRSTGAETRPGLRPPATPDDP